MGFTGIVFGFFWCPKRLVYHDISLARYFLDRLGYVGSLVRVVLIVLGVTIHPDFHENWPKMAYFQNTALYTLYLLYGKDDFYTISSS